MSELDIEALKQEVSSIRVRESKVPKAYRIEELRLDLDKADAIIVALEDRERLHGLLLEWGCHKYHCVIDEEPDYICTCGWEELRAALESQP